MAYIIKAHGRVWYRCPPDKEPWRFATKGDADKFLRLSDPYGIDNQMKYRIEQEK